MMMLLGVLFLIIGSISWTALGVFIERTAFENEGATFVFAISCSVASAICFLNA